jgi:NTE family protein
MRIPIDYIAGTSMGSIVGGLYASGMKPAQIEKVVTSLDWAEAMKDDIPREDRSFRRKADDKNYLIKSKPGLGDDLKIKLPSGLIQGQNIDLVLKELILPVSLITDFNDFKIPFRAVATDIVTGKTVVLGSGDLARAMRASMSIPAIFATTEIDGKMLVDGGISNNLPIDVARSMGADIIIAIDISTPLNKREELTSSLSVTGQLTGILTRRNTEAQIATLTDNDVLIVPDLGDITNSDFEQANEAIPKGRKAAENKRQDLSRLSLSPQLYAEYQVSLKSHSLSKRKLSNPIIEFFHLNNDSRLSDEVILARLKIKKGSPLDLKKLEDEIGKIYGLELFENISYDIVEENGQTGLVINVKERSWGPNYLQVGFSMNGNQDGDHYYNFAFAYTRTAINRLNGEWRSAIQLGESFGAYTEIYQPLSYNSKYFIHPRLIYNENTFRLYSKDGDKLAEYDVAQYGADISVGREFGTWGESRIGITRMRGDTEVDVGSTAWPEYDFDRGEIYAQLSVDKLDNLIFPHHGFYGSVKYVRSEENLGADSEFDQLQIDGLLARSWGNNTLIAGAKIYTTLDNNAPIQNRFELGGLFNLAGFNDDQLSGQQLGLLQLGYMRKISDLIFLPTYLGLTLESGNVWEDKDDISFGDDSIYAGSIFIGLDTFLGPFFLGYGIAEDGNHSIYFYRGKVF